MLQKLNRWHRLFALASLGFGVLVSLFYFYSLSKSGFTKNTPQLLPSGSATGIDMARDYSWAARMLFQVDQVPILPIDCDRVELGLQAMAKERVEVSNWNLHDKEVSWNAKVPVILRDEAGQLACLMDVFELDGQEIYLLAMAGAKPVALNKSRFFAHPWTSVTWLRDDGNNAAYKKISSSLAGGVSLDRTWVSLGFIDPMKTSQAVCTITNYLNYPVTICNVHTSCGCVAVASVTGEVLQPGDKRQVGVSLEAPATGGTMRQSVVFDFSSPHDGEIIRKRVKLFAWSPSTLMPVPHEIDFGTIAPYDMDQRHLVTIRLSQTVYDSFMINSIDTEDLPLKVKIRENKSGDLINYVVSFELDGDSALQLNNNNTNMNIRIHTNSKWRPSLDIPVKFKIVKSVELYPGIVSFGIIPSRIEVGPKKVQLRHCDGKPITVGIISIPDDFKAQLSLDAGLPEISVTAKPTQPGFLSGEIQIRVNWEGGRELHSIPCSFLARHD